MRTETEFQLKVCGITQLEDARYVVAAGATHLGFIQDEDSPRFISTSKAKEIIEWVYGATPVGVFVDSTLDVVRNAIGSAGFQMVQLHGSETPEYCSSLEVPVIKVISVTRESTATDLQQLIDSYEPVTDWLMFDTSRSIADRSSFDWSLLTNLKIGKPFFLAGGINPANVVDAITNIRPNGIDISSGLESSPGIKDFDKIDELIGAIEEWTL